MELTDAMHIPFPPAAVAGALSDLALVRASLENCESLARLSGGEFMLTLTVPVGPLRGRYEVRLHIADVDDKVEREPSRVLHRVINFKAGAAGVGSLRGQIEIALDGDASDAASGAGSDAANAGQAAKAAGVAEVAKVADAARSTRIDYAIWTALTGPLAELPPGQIENALQELAEDFFAEFAAVVEAKHGKGPNRTNPGGWSRRQHVFLRPISLAGLAHRSARNDAPASATPGRLSSLLLGQRGAHGLDRQAPQAMPAWGWALAVAVVGALLYLLHRLQ